MEPPVGNPNVSLLPQPAIPAPIEAMRGGGMGMTNENVSLLPQPAQPAPIEAMKGGGAVPQLLGMEIEKTILTKAGTPSKKKESLPTVEVPDFVPLTLKSIENYTKYRQLNVWKGVAKLPEGDLTETLKNYERKLTSQVYVFYFQVRTFAQYLKIQEKIKKIMQTKRSEKSERETDSREYFFIILFDEEPEEEITDDAKRLAVDTENQKTYENIFRSFIYFTNELHTTFGLTAGDNDFDLFFLSKRKIIAYSRPGDEGGPKNKNHKDVSKRLKYMEPDSVCFKSGEGTNLKTYCFLSPRRITDKDIVRGLKGITNPVYFTNSKKDTLPLNIKVGIDISKLEMNKRYFIDLEWAIWYALLNYQESDVNSLSNIFEPEEEAEKAKGKGDPPVKRTPTEKPGATTSDAAEGTKTASAKKPSVSTGTMTNDSLTKPKRIFKLEDKEPSITVDLGDQIFKIRAYSETTVAEWKAGKFSEEEQNLLKAIGLNDEFSKKASGPAPRNEIDEMRIELLAGRGKLLEILSSTTCLKTRDYMMKSECEFMRDFLQDLLYIRQMDRIQAITKQLSGVDDFLVDVGKLRASTAAALKVSTVAAELIPELIDVFSILRPLLTSKKVKTAIKAPFDKIPFPLIFDDLEEAKDDASASGPKPIVTTLVLPENDGTILPKISGTRKTRTLKSPKMNVVGNILVGLNGESDEDDEGKEEDEEEEEEDDEDNAGSVTPTAAASSRAAAAGTGTVAKPSSAATPENRVRQLSYAKSSTISATKRALSPGKIKIMRGSGEKEYVETIDALKKAVNEPSGPIQLEPSKRNDASFAIYWKYLTQPYLDHVSVEKEHNKYQKQIEYIVKNFKTKMYITNINDFNLFVRSRMVAKNKSKETDIQRNIETIFNKFKANQPLPAEFQEFQDIINEYTYKS